MTNRFGAVLKDPGFWGDNAALIGLVVIGAVFSVLTPFFLTWPNISDLLVSASILLVLATAQQFSIVTGGIDLSIAANLPWAAVVFGLAYNGGLGMPLAIIAAILSGTLVGLINGLIIAKLKVNDFIATLGMLGVMNGVALIVSGGQSFAVNSHFLQSLALGSIGPIRYFYLIAILIAVGAHLVFTHTAFGTHVLATGGNRDAARNMGIPTDRMKIAVYVIDGALVGLAAILLVARTGGSDPSLQTSQLLTSIASVVLGGSSLFGGRAAVLGTVAGALVLTTLLNGFTLLQVSEYYQPIAVGIVVIAAAVLSRLQK
ncbi:MAG: ABC transporter permease [Acidiphilium sp.]|jgi:Ribose/xylose/arabinose/galactoside ABC-type transport systems, permease components|uniref:ABC transporter permease n=1 Tax=Acidiphilium acidophilum TaxID=76588 RepID=A0AAW9DPN3_ACIAO|nr:ABC transporter permease [Acidiphilium acidophilum]MDD2862227.1 ABC transporter permease [Acidiphilium sp.]MDX5930378.1 ABC transporter permease [Acidiphilium acidophilum]